MPEPLTRPLFDPAAAWRAWWESVGVRYPLSGDVTQAIDTAFVRAMAERRIADELAAYGRQLARILDALDVLVRADDRSGLSAADRRALDDVRALRAGAAATTTDELLSRVRALRANPEANADALRRLREALDS